MIYYIIILFKESHPVYGKRTSITVEADDFWEAYGYFHQWMLQEQVDVMELRNIFLKTINDHYNEE